MQNSKVIQLMDEYPDSRRHPLLIENPDWDVLTGALEEWASIAGNMDTKSALQVLRLIIEVTYVMGYETGSKNG